MICEYCQKEHDGTFASGRFCTRKCAYGYSTKTKRQEINQKVSAKLTLPKRLVRCSCGTVFAAKRKHTQFCSTRCARNHCSDETKKKISDKRTAFCKNIAERARLRDIGRRGGFGKKGYTASGHRYESTLEQTCFEYLESKNIIFEAHKQIPSSSKVSDIFLPHLNLWIEIDGIDREKKKRWLGKDYDYWIAKLKIYDDQKLNLKIVKSLDELKAAI